MSLDGLDVYEGTGAIDWHRVRNAGKQFVFVRGAYGDRIDKMAAQNVAGAKNEGLICGLYHFYRQPRALDAQRQAMLNAIDQVRLGSGDLPPVIDVEDNPNFDGAWNTANNAAYIVDLRNWLSVMEDKFGKKPIIYVRAGFWSTLGNPTGFNAYPLWIAHYGVASPRLPSGWRSYSFWQMTDQGQVDGIPRDCNLDVFDGTLNDLQTMTLP